ncbi:MAG: MBL fold metallo-hydrolase, partial [Granulosicoccaceae bacterium]
PLVAVLLTHHHADHVDLADTLASKLGIPVYMNQVEIDTYGFSCTGLTGINDDQLNIAGMDIAVIKTPGHTAGAVSYLVEGNLYSGDTLFIEGCGECVSAGADAGQLYDSLQLLLEKVPPKARVYPGHRFKRVPGMSMSYVSKNNIFLQTRDRAAFIEYRERPITANGQKYL